MSWDRIGEFGRLGSDVGVLFGSLSSAAAAAGPTCVPPKWATLICTQSFLVRFFKSSICSAYSFCFCCQIFIIIIINFKAGEILLFFFDKIFFLEIFWWGLSLFSVCWLLIQKVAPVINKGIISVCWLLIQKMGPVINKGPRVSYS